MIEEGSKAHQVRLFCRWLHQELVSRHSIHSIKSAKAHNQDPEAIDYAIRSGFVRADDNSIGALDLTQRGQALVDGFPVVPRFTDEP